MPAKLRKRKIMPGQLPLFAPESDWSPPTPDQWPDFRAMGVNFIGVDTESHDPLINTKGPGFIRGDAKVMGVSLASEHGDQVYLPLFHPEDNVENPDKAIEYLRYQLAGDEEKCGANLMYELESLQSIGVELKGPLADIQIAEPLLDEDRLGGYGLESLSQAYLGIGKDETLLNEAELAYSVEHKKGFANLPARFVGPYAETDAYNPIEIFLQQRAKMYQEELLPVFEVERKLQRVLFKMRMRGVRIDMDRAQRLSNWLQREVEPAILAEIRQHVSLNNPNSSNQIGVALESLGIPVPRTPPSKNAPNGNYSITNEWLNDIGDLHPVAAKLREYRKTVKMRRDFIDTLLEDSVNGRIYSNWRQLRQHDDDRGDEGAGGTRSGRIAATKFNLTQVPSRDPYWGPMIRGLFIADDGKVWVKNDYSQQEPRITLHYAVILKLSGAQEILNRYIEDPSTDYHQMTADLILERTSKEVIRRHAKDINLGATYGMGKAKLMMKLGVAQDKAAELLKAYHEGVPYVKALEKKAMARADEQGFITTLLGRRRRFDDWEPSSGNAKTPIRGLAKAREVFGDVGLVRSKLHKALNAIIQGGAADQMKQTLVALDDEGLAPQVQVYDEVDGSYENDPAIFRRIKDIMEHTVELTVPFLVEPEVGPSWGETKEIEL